MRKPLPLLVFVLLSLLGAAVPAQALSVPTAPAVPALTAEEAEETEDEGEAGEGEKAEEECEYFVEEGENCAEATVKGEAEELAESEACVLEDATATVAANRSNGTVRLTIRYKTYRPSAVAIDTRLRGSKGGLHVGAGHTRFRRAGVFHDSFGLNEKEMARAVAAREFAIELRAVNTPASCALDLTAHRGGGRKLFWS